MFVLKVFSKNKCQIWIPFVNNVLYGATGKMDVGDGSVLWESICNLTCELYFSWHEPKRVLLTLRQTKCFIFWKGNLHRIRVMPHKNNFFSLIKTRGNPWYKSKSQHHFWENSPGERRLLCTGQAIIKTVSSVNPFCLRSIED